MAKIIPISSPPKKGRKIIPSQKNNRRQELKSKRRLRTLLALVRTLLIMSLAGGAFWLLTLPKWVIRSGEDIEIEGNQFLSDDEVRSMMPLSYPQPVLTLSTENLKEKLKEKAPFEQIVISKAILPPEITVKVVERQPVAMALAPVFSPSQKKTKITRVGYLDEKGILVPNKFYQSIPDPEKSLPNFKIIGIPEQYLPYWPDLYSLISQSEVKITEINWQNPNNLILKTELGQVHLGPYTSQFPKQLMMLAKMKSLTKKVHPSQIIYLDLSDPNFPSFKPKKLPETDKKEKK